MRKTIKFKKFPFEYIPLNKISHCNLKYFNLGIVRNEEMNFLTLIAFGDDFIALSRFCALDMQRQKKLNKIKLTLKYAKKKVDNFSICVRNKKKNITNQNGCEMLSQKKLKRLRQVAHNMYLYFI